MFPYAGIYDVYYLSTDDIPDDLFCSLKEDTQGKYFNSSYNLLAALVLGVARKNEPSGIVDVTYYLPWYPWYTMFIFGIW